MAHSSGLTSNYTRTRHTQLGTCTDVVMIGRRRADVLYRMNSAMGVGGGGVGSVGEH